MASSVYPEKNRRKFRFEYVGDCNLYFYEKYTENNHWNLHRTDIDLKTVQDLIYDKWQVVIEASDGKAFDSVNENNEASKDKSIHIAHAESENVSSKIIDAIDVIVAADSCQAQINRSHIQID